MKKKRFLFYLLISLQLVGLTNAKTSYYPLLTNSENLKVNYASKFKKNSEHQPKSSSNNTSNLTTNLILQGIIDFNVPEGGANGRALHFLATGEIADLSIYGFGIANGGGGSDGQEYTFEAIQVAAGDDILVLRNTTAMSNYLGDCYAAFEHIYTNTGVNGSGDDAIELFMNGSVVETFGDIQNDGTGEVWEYTDSWAYKVDDDWTYGALNCTDNSTTIFNSSCLYPICSDYSSDGCTNDLACNYDETASTDDGSCTFFESGSTSLTFPLYYNAVENEENGEEYDSYPVVMNEDGTLIGYDEENYNYRVCENGASYSYTGTFYDGYEGTGTWDPSSLEITGAYYESFFEETISFTYTYIPIPTCTSEETLLTVLGGAHLVEKSWTITECDGTEIASGGAPYAQCINLEENYIINLVDDIGDGDGTGDGWDGTEMTIADQTYTIQDGASESYSLGSCSIEGCTESFACNYDETANTNDGSCTFFESGTTSLTFPLNYAASEAYSNGNEYQTYTIVYNQDGTVSDSNNNNFTYQVCSDGSSFNYDEDIGSAYQGTWDPANFDITGDFYDSDEDDTISFTYTYIPTCTTEEKLLTVLGGAYLGEKSWAITECDGTEIASGGAPYAQCINLGENYIINLVDDVGDGTGDGWDGTEMNIAGTNYTMTDNVASIEIGVGSCSIEGCTESFACNYDETANSNDGSCTFFESGTTSLTFPLNYAASEAYSNGNEYDTYTIVYNQDGTVSDSNDNNFTYQVCSDGSSFNYDEDIGSAYQGTWDPANFDITGDFYDSDEDDTISFTYTYIPTCTTEEKLLTVLGGAYLGEKSWTITECDGTEIASGGAPYAQCVNLAENYIINLVDDVGDGTGDGWNGTEMTIADQTYTIQDGASESYFLGSCSIEGCTNNTAPNYNELANLDDGSCEIASGWYLISSDVTVSSDNALYINSNLTVNNTGNLTIKSDANSSGSLLVSGTATGNIIYERYIPDTAWHLVSAPVTSQEINSFTNADNSIVTKEGGSKFALGNYINSNSSGSKWEYFTTSSLPTAGNFKSGQGYSLNRTSAGNYTFKGQMATADVNYTLSSSSNDDDYWTCIGNPYPSFLLASDGDNPSLLKNNDNVLNQNYKALYVWHESQYIVINQISEKTYLAPGQGIMVNSINGSQTFTFSKDLLSHQTENNTFYRSLNHPTINLFLSNENSKVSTTVKYVDECTTNLDPGYDAGALIEGDPELIINTQLVQGNSEIDHTLQCLPNNELDSYTIPISVFAKAETELLFSASHTDFSEDVYIYLKDLLTGEVTDLKQGDYQITTQTDLEGTGRFYLFTTPEELNILMELVQPITIYNTERELIISGMQKNENSSLQIYNAIGQEVFAKQLNTEKIRINLPVLPTGVYMTKIKNNKRLITKKIIIRNRN